MPQTTMLPVFHADYPITAPVQKPGGVAISTTLWAHAVPNKPQWTSTAQQMATVSADDPSPLDRAAAASQRNNAGGRAHANAKSKH